MQIFPIIGVILGVLSGIILLCLCVAWIDKKHPSDEFDERQKIVQGKASSLSLVVGAIYFVISLIPMIHQVEGTKTIEPYLLVMIGILLMLVVNHTYCLIGQAALPLSQKPLANIICHTIMGLIDLWYFYVSAGMIPLSWVGKGSKPFIYLFIGIDFLYLALTHTIQYFRDRKAANE